MKILDTLGLVSPTGATVLFNGRDLSDWTTRDGKPAGWEVREGEMHVVPKTGDVITQERFTDFYLHIEFRCPDMPDATGQKKANSGVFLQGRYEIQVLDSYGIDIPGTADCGSMYDRIAVLTNACLPAMQWQTYDAIFRAPREADGDKGPRLTVYQNGIIVHNNIQMTSMTGAPIDDEIYQRGPILLQDHGDLVAFRNAWLVPLALEGSDTYGPR